MKILIIEDHHDLAYKMAEIIQDFGEVTVCTTIQTRPRRMPSKEEAEKLIAQADLVLIDDELVGAGYRGMDLLPACSKKSVVGISSTRRMGQINFYNKIAIPRPEAIAQLRSCLHSAVLN